MNTLGIPNFIRGVPAYTAAGEYDLRTNERVCAAALASLEFIRTAPAIYGSQGPAAVLKEILGTVEQLQEQLRQEERRRDEVWARKVERARLANQGGREDFHSDG